MSKYVDERDKKYLYRLKNEIVPCLPNFCFDFFIGIASTTTVLTRYNYATDLRVFFEYLILPSSILNYINSIKEIKESDLENIDSKDIERYLDYINGYITSIKNEYAKNADRAKARKLSAIRSLFKYLYNHDMISKDVTTKVAMPKIREKEIIRMENKEVKEMLELLEKDTVFDSNMQNAYNINNTIVRDNAILSLLVGTGIRVSECVGINLSDLNFDNKSFLVTRKGEKESILYLNDEIIDAIKKYLVVREAQLERKKIMPENEEALFLSLQNKRINVRTVEVLVKKYAQKITPLKKITPHKLRSTYGTELYRETKDIYVVAEVLGHKDINTTKKHYAAINEDIKKNASEKVNFKKNDDNDN